LWGDNNSKVTQFGEILYEFDLSKSWVQGVAWSPNGLNIAFTGHASILSFANLNADGRPKTENLYLKGLPAVLVNFLDDKTCVTIGFDNNPTVYENSGGGWKEGRQLDSAGGSEKKAPGPPGGNSASAARNVFQDRDTRGKTGETAGVKEEPPIKTIHQNLILDFKIRGPKKFSTSGVDGRIVQWSA